MTTAPTGVVAALLVLAAASGAPAQQPPAHAAPHARQDSTHHAPAYRREVSATLARQARISEDSARGIAMRRIPGGVVQALELERENGHLIYSFDLKIAGHSGIEEVNVDALNGRVLAVEHETPHADSAERRPVAPARPAPAPRRP